MFEFCFKLVRNEKILLALQKKIVLVLDIINNKEVQQHMTNVITYIIIHSCLMFVNIFQRKNICKDLRLYSNQKINILYSEFILTLKYSCLNLWFEQTSDSEVYKTYYN